MLSKSAKYCLKVLVHIAKNQAPDRKFPLSVLSKELDIPKFFLGNLLQQLSKRKLIGSKKGPNGGFYLTLDHLQLSPLDYIREIEGEQFMHWCILDQAPCNRTEPCSFHDIYTKLTSEFLNEMNAIKLADINSNLIHDKLLSEK